MRLHANSPTRTIRTPACSISVKSTSQRDSGHCSGYQAVPSRRAGGGDTAVCPLRPKGTNNKMTIPALETLILHRRRSRTSFILFLRVASRSTELAQSFAKTGMTWFRSQDRLLYPRAKSSVKISSQSTIFSDILVTADFRRADGFGAGGQRRFNGKAGAAAWSRCFGVVCSYFHRRSARSNPAGSKGGTGRYPYNAGAVETRNPSGSERCLLSANRACCSNTRRGPKAQVSGRAPATCSGSIPRATGVFS